MNFKEFVDGVNKLLEAQPESADLTVVTSIDDEGNGFNPVFYGPQVDGYNENDREFDENLPANAVCIN